MDTIAKREYIAIGFFVGVLLISLLPALLHARREERDGIRRQEVIQHKYALEQIFNREEAYPALYDAKPHEYIVLEESEDMATAWYIRAYLENAQTQETGFDYEYNIYYRTGVEGGRSFYDVCGGEFTCGVSPESVQE